MSKEIVLSLSMQTTPKQENPIHLVMWEGGNSSTQELLDRISTLEKTVSKLMESKASSIFFPPALHPTPRGIEVRSRANSLTADTDIANIFKTVSKSPPTLISLAPLNEMKSLKLDEAADDDVESELEFSEVNSDIVDPTEEDKDEDNDEEEEDEVEEFKEQEWKGKTYYKDSDNQMYELDDEGDLIETPIGYWKEETQKLIKYKTA
jgi:hypothetical protein